MCLTRTRVLGPIRLYSSGIVSIRDFKHLTHKLHSCKQTRLERRTTLKTEPLRIISLEVNA